ncbi:MAG: DUF2235 domain-containing protein [Acidimicrobiia bacterium]|nr:DUF2235 domain-containing protein [Acidimicrobiia bacterium]
MGRNIVLCLDGTGNQVKAKGNTNVLGLYEMLDLSDPTRQVAFYDPGVGTFSTPGAWTPLSSRFTKLMGLAFGTGIKTNLEEAYTYLIRNYQPGDSVSIFGFSRGAFTARGLAGLTHRAGVMRPGAENLVPYLVRSYTKGDRWSDDDWDKVDRFAATFSHEIGGSHSLPIHYLGLWDSVKALGYLRFDPKWPYTRQLPNARTIRHAVSINERRRPYEEYLVHPKGKTDLREAWFAGVHSDVGGGFSFDRELATIALKWMTDGALDQGLLLRPGAYKKACSVSKSDAEGTVHEMGKVWALLTFRTRPITPVDARIHQSVKDRMAAMPAYTIGADLTKVQWEDADWTAPHPLAP